MKISLQAQGLLDPRQFSAWSAERQRAIRQAVARGFKAGGGEVVAQVRAQMHSAFRVARPGFVKSMRAKVLEARRDRLPALLIGSRIPWLGIHERGGTVRGNLLIPLLPTRIGPKRFKAVVDGLMRSGNAFFKEVDGKVLLFAENIRENSRELVRFKRAERVRTGAKRLARGQEIPIAVLVKSVQLKRRLDLEGTVRRNLPRLAQAIQTELART